MPTLVIDHDSTDRTRDVAVARGAKIINRKFAGFVEERRFGLSQVKTPWTLMIDADEALDEALRLAILAAPDDCNGYMLRRTTFYEGRALRMWRNEPLLRLFRTSEVRVDPWPAAGGSAQLHERWTCTPPVGTLGGRLLHYSYPSHEAYLDKYDRYTSIEAGGVRPSRRDTAFEIARGVPRFLWYVFGKGAIIDGPAGIMVAWLSAFYPAVVRIKALREAA